MAKQKIPGWMIMIAGLGIMGYTKFIEYRKPDSKIGYFFWVGLVFVLYGGLREFVPRFVTKKKEKEVITAPLEKPSHHPQAQHPAMHAPHSGVQASHHHVQGHTHPSHPYQPQYLVCPSCHRHSPSQARFCYLCGHRFY